MKKTSPKTEKPKDHAAFLASLREAHEKGRPISFFRQWPVQYLVEAGLPQDWLQKCGLTAPDGSATDLPNQCSQRQFAAIVSRLYGKPVNQSAVSHAVRHEGLSVATTASNGRIRTDAALRWWETHKIGVAGSAIATEQDDRAARTRIAREREQMELDAEKRKFDDRWMLTGTAYFIMDSFGVNLKTLLRDSIERGLAQKVEAIIKDSVADEGLRQTVIDKLRPEFPAAFDQMQIAIELKLDDIGREAEEMDAKLKSELK